LEEYEEEDTQELLSLVIVWGHDLSADRQQAKILVSDCPRYVQERDDIMYPPSPAPLPVRKTAQVKVTQADISRPGNGHRSNKADNNRGEDNTAVSTPGVNVARPNKRRRLEDFANESGQLAHAGSLEDVEADFTPLPDVAVNCAAPVRVAAQEPAGGRRRDTFRRESDVDDRTPRPMHPLPHRQQHALPREQVHRTDARHVQRRAAIASTEEVLAAPRHHHASTVAENDNARGHSRYINHIQEPNAVAGPSQVNHHRRAKVERRTVTFADGGRGQGTHSTMMMTVRDDQGRVFLVDDGDYMKEYNRDQDEQVGAVEQRRRPERREDGVFLLRSNYQQRP
jgi:hypothetical protein